MGRHATTAATPTDPEETSDGLPSDALPINVEGQELTGPDAGFGALWRKRYRCTLEGIELTPEELIQEWRDHFGKFWPEGNHFYRPLIGLEPGEVAISDLEMPVGARLSTGVVVHEVTPTSFTFVTTKGHTFAAFNTFSAFRDQGTTVAQIEILMRASDPLFEIGLMFGGHKREDMFWMDTLDRLAAHVGAKGRQERTAEVLDKSRKWRNARNITRNSFLRTAAYMAIRPVRRLASIATGRGGQS